jgi:hypothetical protein
MRLSREQRVAALKPHMAAIGIAWSTALPPLWPLLWRLGLDVPPPLFLAFWRIVVWMGGAFALAWGAGMWWFVWSPHGIRPVFGLAMAAGGGILFGLAMAAYYRAVARKHRLPSWDAYTGAP